MHDRPSSPDLSRYLMEIAQNPQLRQDMEALLGDFSHQCRNRLNSLKLSLYLANRQAPGRINEAWRTLESDYQSLETQLNRVQMICGPMCLSLVKIGLCLLFEDRRESWSKLMADRGSELEFLRPESRSLAQFDVNQLGAALDAMVAWRARLGIVSPKTSVRWWVDSGQAHITWIEPKGGGPADCHQSDQQEFAWTLPTLTRVLSEHGGSLEVDERDGWALSLSWPVNRTSTGST